MFKEIIFHLNNDVIVLESIVSNIKKNYINSEIYGFNLNIHNHNNEIDCNILSYLDHLW